MSKNSLFELAGGQYTAPIAVGAWASTGKERLIGFINGSESCNATLIEYVKAPQIEPTYIGCLPNHWNRFPERVKAVTFSQIVTGVFEIE